MIIIKEYNVGDVVPFWKSEAVVKVAGIHEAKNGVFYETDVWDSMCPGYVLCFHFQEFKKDDGHFSEHFFHVRPGDIREGKVALSPPWDGKPRLGEPIQDDGSWDLLKVKKC